MAGHGLTVLLGPGFAPGLAGLGVLDSLKERNVPVDCVVGVNTGALAAALWAVGSDLFFAARVLARLPWHRLAVSQDLSLADPLLTALKVLTRRASFRDVGHAIAVVAADADTGEAVWIEEGSVAEAVRASLAVPGLFHPLELFGRRLADGGSVWPLAGERFAGRRLLEVDFRTAAREQGEPSPFGARARELAWTAARAWGVSIEPGRARLVVRERVGGLLDFHLAEEWYLAGKRAFAAWLYPAAEDEEP